ncbi:hypothetical protein OAW68_04485 [Alphaproteobacteria bacterium]|nr:hypothetical protein [Alphaproteobacteria bacterium]
MDRQVRVLLLTNNNFCGTSGGSALLRSLFHNFDRGQLFVVSNSVAGENGNLEHRLRLTSLLPRKRLLKLLTRLLLNALRNRVLPSFQEIINIVIQGSKYSLAKRAHQKIGHFKPDLIYAWAGDSKWANFINDIVAVYNIPLVVHFMDNHFGLKGGSYTEKLLNEEYRKNIIKVLAKMDSIFTISDAMGFAYSKKFGKSYEVFHALIDKSSWKFPDKTRPTCVFRITFSGSVEAGQINSIRDVAAAVEQLNNEGFKIELMLCVTEYYEKQISPGLQEFKHVRYHRHPDFSGLRSVLTNSDVLLLAYGFDPITVDYYRYSFATKLVPYMLSGRCILAYGPETVEPIKYLKKGGWSHMVTQYGVEDLTKAIRILINNPDKRQQYARLAYDHGVLEHDIEKNSARFMDALCKIAFR